MTNSSIVRYNTTSQVLHWATAIVVLVAFIFGPGGSEERIYSSTRDFDRQLHETLGVCVFLLVVVRVVWRMFNPPPESPQFARWMMLAAKAAHAGLYLLLFALPITAIIGAWLEGHPLTLLTGVEIAPLLQTSHANGKTIATIHTWLGDAIMWLAGIHAFAGIYHHVILKDTVLVSMLPRHFKSRNPNTP